MRYTLANRKEPKHSVMTTEVNETITGKKNCSNSEMKELSVIHTKHKILCQLMAHYGMCLS